MKAAGIIFRTPEREVLFLRRGSKGDHAGEWCWPGGEVEAGETFADAARRETVEETGYVPRGRLGIVDRATNADGVDFATFVQAAYKFRPDLDDEHVDFAWCSIATPPRPLHPGVEQLLLRRPRLLVALDERMVTGSRHQHRSLRRRLERAGGKVLRPVRPNLGLQAAYRARLDALIDQMHASVLHWVSAAWRGNPPELAMDAAITVGPAEPGSRALFAYIDGQVVTDSGGNPRRFKTQKSAEKAALEALRRLEEPVLPIIGEVLPANELNAAIKALASRWIGRINGMAPRLAEYFGTSVADRSEKTLRSILRQGGISVRFQPSKAQLDVLQASIHENVALIRSIPEQYFTNIEGAVMRSVTAGRDLGSLAKELREQYGVTKRRAALIARDQNNKATAAMTRARQKDLGITEAIWKHSGGGKHPRPKHVAASGNRYDVRKGLPIGDKGQYVFPGEEINCRCVSMSVIPGFD